MAKAPAIVLSSGGLHSLVCAGLAAREYRIALLHVKDQRVSQTQALAAYERQAAYFKPMKSWVIEGGYLRQMSFPVESAGVVSSTSSDPHGPLIPLRDLHLLAVAAGYGRLLKAGVIYWGVQFDPKAGDAMAKNMETVQVFNQLLEVMGGEPGLTVRTPLMGLEDAQVVELGYQIGVPFAASWTCQLGTDSPCMSCPACSRRIRAFRGAQMVDPLVGKK